MRLIDADTLNFEGQKYNKSQMKAILDFIDAQPTIYDIDKVVEELENKCIYPNDYPGYVVDLEKAIETVKQRVR